MTDLLNGLRVIESSILLPSLLGAILADLGADVIKVERPGVGDYVRHIGAELSPAYSTYHLYLNRGKRSVALDVRTPQGRAAFNRLIASADVYLTNILARSAEDLGVDYVTLRKINPSLVYGHITGFGAGGPYAELPAHGWLMDSLAGARPVERGPAGEIRLSSDKLLGASGNTAGPLYGASGVMAALFRRSRTGEGCYLDISCTDSVLATGWLTLMERRNPETTRSIAADVRESATYTHYETLDGRYLLLAVIEHKFFCNLCHALGRPDLIEMHDASAVMDMGINLPLQRELEAAFKTRTLDEWIELFIAHDIPGGPVLRVDELDDNPHIRERKMLIASEHPRVGVFNTVGNPIKADGAVFTPGVAPGLGEHTAEVLREIGLGEAEVEALEAQARR